MTAPLLAVSAERLAAAIAETVPAGAFDPRDIAVYLIESGAVVPAASLADDERVAVVIDRWTTAFGRFEVEDYEWPQFWAEFAAALEDR